MKVFSSTEIEGVTAFMQICMCEMKFCQIDKISLHTCILDDAKIL